MNPRDTWIFYQAIVGLGTALLAVEGLLLICELRGIRRELTSIKFAAWEKKNENT